MEDGQCISFSYRLGIRNTTSLDIADGRHGFMTPVAGPIAVQFLVLGAAFIIIDGSSVFLYAATAVQEPESEIGTDGD